MTLDEPVGPMIRCQKCAEPRALVDRESLSTECHPCILLPWMMSGAPLLPGALGPLASRCVHRFICAALRRLASRSLSCVVRLASGGAGVGGGEGSRSTHMSPIAEEEEEGAPLILRSLQSSISVHF